MYIPMNRKVYTFLHTIRLIPIQLYPTETLKKAIFATRKGKFQ